MSPLIILITRLEGEPDEWKEVWDFGRLGKADSVAAVIRQGGITFLNAGDDLGRAAELAEGVGREGHDVWVINGYYFAKLKTVAQLKLLDAVRWAGLERGVVIRVHTGQWGTLDEFRNDDDNASELEPYPNLKRLLSEASEYSLMGGGNLQTQVEELAASLKGGEGSRYIKARRGLARALSIPMPRLTAAVEILQMFLPLDIGLQLGDESVEGCRATAGELAGQAGRARGLLAEVLGVRRSGEDASRASEALERLLTLSQEAVGANDRAALRGLFGFKPGRAQGEEDLELDERGFHRTYERLRDILLEVIDNK